MNRALRCAGIGAGCALALLCGGARAADGWVAVDPASLDRLRGGFSTPAGLQIALGVERLVSINGELVARMTLGAAGMQGDVLLIQQGGNNVFSGSLLHAGSTVVQNSLSDQVIRTQTVITATVNSAALLRELNFHHSVGAAALSAAGSH